MITLKLRYYYVKLLAGLLHDSQYSQKIPNVFLIGKLPVKS